MKQLVVFDSVHQAIRAEQKLKQQGLGVEMVPTPREISASCGQSLVVPEEELSAAREILLKEKVPFRGIYSADLRRGIYELMIQGGS